ncbi:MAG: nucleotidyltransferase [Candidatus Hadarchaeales archaeon]
MAYREVVKRIASILNSAGATYALTGALAAGYYGMARSTRDVDFLVAPEERKLHRAIALARKRGFRSIGELIFLPKTFQLEAEEGYRVDFRQAETDHDYMALQRRLRVRLFGRKIWIISAEDLLLQKLRKPRHKDLVDCAATMIRQREKIDMEYLKNMAAKLGIARTFNALAKKVW